MQKLMREMENWRQSMLKAAGYSDAQIPRISISPESGSIGTVPVTTGGIENPVIRSNVVDKPNWLTTTISNVRDLPRAAAEKIQSGISRLPSPAQIGEPPENWGRPDPSLGYTALNNPEDFGFTEEEGEHLYMRPIKGENGKFGTEIVAYNPFYGGSVVPVKTIDPASAAMAQDHRIWVNEQRRQNALQEQARANAEQDATNASDLTFPTSPFMNLPGESPYPPLSDEQADAITKDWNEFQAAGGDPGSVPYPGRTPFYKDPNILRGAGIGAGAGGLLGGGLGYMLGGKKNKTLSTLLGAGLGAGSGALLGGLGGNYFGNKAK